MEGLAGVAIGGLAVAERVAKNDVVDWLILDEHVGAADGVSFRVIVLAVKREMGLRIVLADIFLGYGEHAAGAAGRVVDRAGDPGLIDVVLVGVDEMRHQADHFARGKMVAGLFVRLFVEPADQVFEYIAHLLYSRRSRDEDR